MRGHGSDDLNTYEVSQARTTDRLSCYAWLGSGKNIVTNGIDQGRRETRHVYYRGTWLQIPSRGNNFYNNNHGQLPLCQMCTRQLACLDGIGFADARPHHFPHFEGFVP
jgi:hypothetical protein